MPSPASAHSIRAAQAGWLACCALACSAPPALGQVLEIGPSGATVIGGPSLHRPEGVTALAAPPQSAAPDLGPGAQRRREAVMGLMREAGRSHELSPQLIEAVAWVESRFRTGAISPKGAIGMMQLMPATAASLGVDPGDPAENVRGGAAYLREMLVLFDGDVEKAVAAYNAGPDAVRRHGGTPPWPETQAYVAAVLDYLAMLSMAE